MDFRKIDVFENVIVMIARHNIISIGNDGTINEFIEPSRLIRMQRNFLEQKTIQIALCASRHAVLALADLLPPHGIIQAF